MNIEPKGRNLSRKNLGPFSPHFDKKKGYLKTNKKLKGNFLVKRTDFAAVAKNNVFGTTKDEPFFEVQNSDLRKKNNYPEVFFNTCFDKNHLKTLIAWFLDQYGQKNTIALVETLKQVGFHQATQAGVSLGVDDLQIPHQKPTLLSQASVKITEATNAIQKGNVTSVEKSQSLIDAWNQTSETLRQTAVQNFRSTNPVNPVYMMAFSGARGNISQVRQLVAMRGLMADPQGAILEFPIQSNFREGLTVTEYLISCFGARKGLVDTALRTATSGYLTRRLVYAVQHVVVHVTDCYTQKGIILKDKNLEQRLIGRVLLQDLVLEGDKQIKKNTIVSPRLAKQIALQYKEILIRSPLTCQTEKSVCQLCYGMDLAQGKIVSLGEAVGIIAAQSIGEPGTQLTMRTFHTGGVGVFSEHSMTSFAAPFSGKVQFLETLSGLFVRTPQGKIVYIVKQKKKKNRGSEISSVEKNEAKTILKLVSIKDPTLSYEIKSNDIPPGSLLWVREGEIVQPGSLLVQASRLETAKTEMPESTHPVRTPISGEIFFESMKLRIIQKDKSLKKDKLIEPEISSLSKLGNFWIFSSFIQKEPHVSKFFFKKGDLISKETPIQQFNLGLAYKGQLKKFDSFFVFGNTPIEISFSKIDFAKGYYLLSELSTKNKTTFSPKKQKLVSYTKNSNSTSLRFYPFYKKDLVLNYPDVIGGYCSVLANSISTLKNTDDRVLNSLQCCIWAPHATSKLKRNLNFTIQFDKNNRDWTKNSVFVNQKDLSFLVVANSKTFSKKGVFQLGLFNNISWQVKTNFKEIREDNSFIFIKNISISDNLKKKHEKKTKINRQFLNFGFRKIKKSLSFSSQHHLIQKTNGWFFVSKNAVKNNFNCNLAGVLLKPGTHFENVAFSNSYISANLIKTENLGVLNSRKNSFSVSCDFGVNSMNPVLKSITADKEIGPKINKKTRTFCFYKKRVSLSAIDPILEKNNIKNSKGLKRLKTQFDCFTFDIKKKKSLSHLVLFQKTINRLIFPKQTNLFSEVAHPSSISSIDAHSPIFTKQEKTKFTSYHETRKTHVKTQSIIPQTSAWLFHLHSFKIDFEVTVPKKLYKIEQLCRIKEDSLGHQNIFSSLNIQFAQKIQFGNYTQFQFQTFENGWITPYFEITQAYLKSTKSGELREIRTKKNLTYLNILRNGDLSSLSLPDKTLFVKSSIGQRVRWGDEILSGFATPVTGQILKKTSKKINLRRGIPLLASENGLVHIENKDFIQKNDLLITLRSRRLQTEDIVQGIPKIEQLFEARETQGGEILKDNVHTRLQLFFRRALRIRPLPQAVEMSILFIQRFLVDEILQAYSNQGVQISEKHVEVVVRQMTSRVRILHGGGTGLLPGELIQHRMIQQMNQELAKLGRQQARYEPLILGITKGVLQSESFLLAASFQQVSKVLVRSALANKTDFLRGLHENLLVGQPIPAGTGIISNLETTSSLGFKSTDIVKQLDSLKQKEEF